MTIKVAVRILLSYFRLNSGTISGTDLTSCSTPVFGAFFQTFFPAIDLHTNLLPLLTLMLFTFEQGLFKRLTAEFAGIIGIKARTSTEVIVITLNLLLII